MSVDQFAKKKLESVQNALDILESDCLSGAIAKEMAFKWMPELLTALNALTHEKEELLEENQRLSEENDELLSMSALLSLQLHK